jgi:UDP-N-acetylmuramyl pentapeptide phosphotransferase/UDP-N-acetylglucosamine-1-phosphate transferase
LATLALPFVIALLLSLLFGGKVVQSLANAKARQPVSEDAPDAHKIKHGTPTMGGLLILAATLVAAPFGLWQSYARYMEIAGASANAAANPTLSWLLRICAPACMVLIVFVLACGIGVLDDLGKARKKLNGAGFPNEPNSACRSPSPLCSPGISPWSASKASPPRCISTVTGSTSACSITCL